MTRIRLSPKWLRVLFVALCALVALIVISSQIEQHIFRRRAELLLREIRSIELRKTQWRDLRVQFEQWRPQTEFYGPCDESTCSFQITINDSVLSFVSKSNLFVRLDDYFRWKLKLSYNEGPFVRTAQSFFGLYVRMGGHPARVTAAVGVREGSLWSKGISVWIETYAHDVPGFYQGPGIEYTLIASVHSVPRFEYYDGPGIDSQLMVHPDYAIGHPGGCSVCVAGWVIFTPYAERTDVDRLMQFNLACLTRWRRCTTQADLMPVAWSQYLAEAPRLQGMHLECSPAAIKILGRDSAFIAIGEFLEHSEVPNGPSYVDDSATVKVLERMKGDPSWNAGEVRSVAFNRESSEPVIPAGVRLIFFGDREESHIMQIDHRYNCRAVAATETNLTLVRSGMSEDSSPPEKVR
jgi:hypothetical protein